MVQDTYIVVGGEIMASWLLGLIIGLSIIVATGGSALFSLFFA